MFRSALRFQHSISSLLLTTLPYQPRHVSTDYTYSQVPICRTPVVVYRLRTPSRHASLFLSEGIWTFHFWIFPGERFHRKASTMTGTNAYKEAKFTFCPDSVPLLAATLSAFSSATDVACVLLLRCLKNPEDNIKSPSMLRAGSSTPFPYSYLTMKRRNYLTAPTTPQPLHQRKRKTLHWLQPRKLCYLQNLPNRHRSPRKRHRNGYYLDCGSTHTGTLAHCLAPTGCLTLGRKFFTFTFGFNMIGLALAASGHWPYGVKYAGAIVVANFNFAILMRNEVFGRLLYLFINTLFAKVRLVIRLARS